jgi:hypothetical protein
MPITYVFGDPILTQAQSLAFGHNAIGRTETGLFPMLMLRKYPAAFATYRKQCRAERISAGEQWLWHESKLKLIFMIIRDSPVGATRLRYVQNIAMTIARDYRLLGITSLAVAPLGTAQEWPEIRKILDTWFSKCELPVFVYDEYLTGVQAEEDI